MREHSRLEACLLQLTRCLLRKGSLDVACHRLALLVPSGGVVLVEVRPGGPPLSPLRQGAQAVTVYAGGQSALCMCLAATAGTSQAQHERQAHNVVHRFSRLRNQLKCP